MRNRNYFTDKTETVLCIDRYRKEEVSFSTKDRFLNTMVIGATGTGKSSQIFIPLIYRDMLAGNCGITIIDPKEETAEMIYYLSKDFPDRVVHYIDPTDPNCEKINLFAEETEAVIKNLVKLFASEKSETTEGLLLKEFTRTLIVKTVFVLKQFPNLCGGNLNLKSFFDFLCNKGGRMRMDLVKIRSEMKSPSFLEKELFDYFIDHYFEETTDFFEKGSILRGRLEEILSNHYLREVLTPSGNTKVLDFNQVLRNGEIVIINTKNTILGHLGKRFGEFIMTIFVNTVFNRKKTGENLIPHFLYVDEFATYSPVLTDLFSQGRAFQVGTHIALQNRMMLRNCGGEDSTKESFLIESNTRNLVLFPGLNGEDAKYYADQFFNLSAKDLLYRPFGQIIYRIVKDGTMMPPSIGLTFFIDEKVHFDSIKKEEEMATLLTPLSNEKKDETVF